MLLFVVSFQSTKKMVRITESLVRKRAEHNEGLISSLEELTLHQENIEKIEHLHNWCRNLHILLLQSNVISKIENLYKLKDLEYLNLALNCVEKIENLDQLEFLNKLDLTLNFIGDLQSVRNLKHNVHLDSLILTGNPCCDYPRYRDYVIAVLPQLKTLDNAEIKPLERFEACLQFSEIRPKIIQSEFEYKIQRDEQKIRVQQRKAQLENEVKDLPEDERAKRFWESKSENCPETRCEIIQHLQTSKKDNEKSEDKKKIRTTSLFDPIGRPYNTNQGKLKFTLKDSTDSYELNLEVYKFLDTSLIDLDVQPNYVRVAIKNKIFQLVLDEEVSTTKSFSQRSTTTGYLLVKMPKLNVKKFNFGDGSLSDDESATKNANDRAEIVLSKTKNSINSNNFLKGTVNYKNIVTTSWKQNCQSSSSASASLLPLKNSTMESLESKLQIADDTEIPDLL